MRTRIHLLVSLILAAALYSIFNWQVIFIIIGGVLVDIDHYFWYIFKYKKFNMLDCYRWFTTDNVKNNYKDVTGELLIFHTIEFLLATVLLSFYIEFALLFLIGLLTHYFLDLIAYYFTANHFILNHSVISWIVKNKIPKL